MWFQQRFISRESSAFPLSFIDRFSLVWFLQMWTLVGAHVGFSYKSSLSRVQPNELTQLGFHQYGSIGKQSCSISGLRGMFSVLNGIKETKLGKNMLDTLKPYWICLWLKLLAFDICKIYHSPYCAYLVHVYWIRPRPWFRTMVTDS